MYVTEKQWMLVLNSPSRQVTIFNTFDIHIRSIFWSILMVNEEQITYYSWMTLTTDSCTKEEYYNLHLNEIWNVNEQSQCSNYLHKYITLRWTLVDVLLQNHTLYLPSHISENSSVFVELSSITGVRNGQTMPICVSYHLKGVRS